MFNLPQKIITLLIITLCLVIGASYSFAQALPANSTSSATLDVGYNLQVNDTNTQEGDIVVSTDKGLIRATDSYNPRLFGVISQQPLLVFGTKGLEGKPISRNGIAQVNVTTLNGPILAGDYITSSEIKGSGQKATESGYVIGIAMAGLNDQNGSPLNYKDKKISSGKVAVSLKIEYAEITTARNTFRLLQEINTQLFKTISQPDKFLSIFRYIAAGLISVVAIAFSFLTFARAIPKAVEAIGRNPLAQRSILLSLLLNLFLVVLVSSIGIIGALIIIKL